MQAEKANTTTDEHPTVLTRRQLLTTAAAGGAGLAVSALGGAAVGSVMTRAEYEVELTKLRALVALYEQLERVGLDAILQTGMNIVRSALDAVKGGVNLLRDGIAAAESALQAFQGMLDSLRSDAGRVAQGLSDLMQKFHTAEGIVIAVLGTALPLAESITGFFNSLLQKIPFGVGDNIKRAADALVNLIRAIPATVDTLASQFLQSLSNTFFPSSGTSAVQTVVLDPITLKVLEPLKKLLTDTENLIAHWENDLTQPVQAALTERQKIRDQIADYKRQNGIA